ncbi:MAG: saccharopine dehydrogenase NADP-binding domain-containing protein [Dehalococcoidia bacterium]
MRDPAEREHELVLFGATGFTGALTAQYLAKNAPEGFRWALAGRNRDKLEQLRGKLRADVPALIADASDPSSLRRVAEATRVVATTVGPYIRYGEPLVAACAEAGTDYCDLTGEPEFVDRMYIGYDATARETGARLVHCCGFDSIPADLGAYFTVTQLPEGVPIRLAGFLRVRGRPSGGTVASARTIISRLPQGVAIARRRRRAEPAPASRAVRTSTGRPHYEHAVGAWVLPLPVIDPQIVRRSAQALDRYGPEFTYRHYLALGGTGSDMWSMLRRGLLKPGEGPSPEERAESWFKMRFVGEGGGRRVMTEVSGGDPGYDETSKMLGETGMCLARDDLPARSGQLTTASAMGDALVDRLRRAGITFEVLETTG